MKKYTPTIIILFLLLAKANYSIGQIVGTNAFLQGRYLEIGLNNNGSFGTCNANGAIPAGYHPHISGTGLPPTGTNLAEVYDYGHDGWAIGTPPYMGDYTYMGSPFEGWELQVGSGRVQAFQNCAGTMTASVGGLSISGALSGYSNTGGSARVNWNGTAMGGQLVMNMETRVDTNASNVLMTVKLRNVGATPIADVFFLRSCDPDIDGSWTGSANTVNRIVYQVDSSRSYVEASSSVSSAYTFGLGARDSRAHVLIYSSWWPGATVDISTLWSGTYPGSTYMQGACMPPSCSASDLAIGLVFNLGTIPPGDSVTFSYAYVFDGVLGFATAFAPPCSGTPVSGIVNANTSVACATTPVALSLVGYSIASGITYQWQSSPDSTAWTNIAAATNNSYTFSGLTTDTYYRCNLTCTLSGSNAYTPGKKITYSTACPCLHSAGNVLPNTNVACSTTTVVLNNSGYTASSGVTLQWQSSPDSTTWTDIAGATTVPYSFSGLAATTFYRLRATCTATSLQVFSNVRKVVFSATCACSGAPVVTTATASTTYCSSCSLTLNLTGLASGVTGYTYQWQRSATGSSSWVNITGATVDSYTYSPVEAYYYRCMVTCTNSGIATPSNPVFVTVPYTIVDDSVRLSPDTACSGQLFYVRASGTSPLLTVKTSFGDGTSGTYSLTATAAQSIANIGHIYSTPGTYTVKHILYCGSLPNDSVSFTYNHASCRILPLRFYVDADMDCAKGSAEQFNNYPVSVKVDSAGIAIDTLTGTSGIYCKVWGPAGTVYTFTVLPGAMHAVCSAVISDTVLSGVYYYDAKQIGLFCSSTAYDLTSYVTFIANSNVGRATILPRNLLCNPTDGSQIINYSPKYNYSFPGSYSSPTPFTNTAHSVTWHPTHMSCASSSFPSLITTRAKSVSGIPLPVGDTVHTRFVIGPVIGDDDTGNNIIDRVDTVVGPYDPNFIQVSPAGCFDNDTTLQFVVHFENMGTDTAQNVYVLDTLSPYLNFKSLEALASSAVMDIYQYQEGGYNIVKFDFPGIKLLDSSWHGLNEGMFVYKIKTATGLAVGQTISSRVGIYFDYNGVVMTNTVGNTKGCPLPEKTVYTIRHSIELYPNPTTGLLTISSNEKMQSIFITNLLGQILLKTECDTLSQLVDVSALPAGIYLVKINDSSVRRFVKQ